jgi:hypothetical protein
VVPESHDRPEGRIEMTKLRNEFPKKDWKHCCGKGCTKCDIHNAYLDAYGKKEGEKKFAKDHARMH